MRIVTDKIFKIFGLKAPENDKQRCNVLRPILLLDVALEQVYILDPSLRIWYREFKTLYKNIKLAESIIKLELNEEERVKLADEMDDFFDFIKQQTNTLELAFNNSMLKDFDTQERYLMSKLYVIDVVCQSVILYNKHLGIKVNKFVFFDFLKKVSILCYKICDKISGKKSYNPNDTNDIKLAIRIFINRIFKYGEENNEVDSDKKE